MRHNLRPSPLSLASCVGVGLSIALASACMGPEYPDEYDDGKEPITTADAGVSPPIGTGAFPTAQTDAGSTGSSFLPTTPGGSAGGGNAGGTVNPLPSTDASVTIPPGGGGGGGTRDAGTSMRDASTGTGSGSDAGTAMEAGTSTPDASGGGGGNNTGSSLTSCSISASTDASDAFLYAGKYGCAVWIGNSSNKVVKAFFLATRIASRSGVSTYQRAASGVTVDVVAGATLNSPKQHMYTWNLKDTSGAAVPPGKYTLNVETRSSNGDVTVSVPFDISNGPVSADGTPNGGIRSASIDCK